MNKREIFCEIFYFCNSSKPIYNFLHFFIFKLTDKKIKTVKKAKTYSLNRENAEG